MKVERMPRSLLLLHGTPLTPQIWSETVNLLGSIPVITPDTTQVKTSPDAQSQLAASVLQDLPDGDLDVVGHSFGGQIALELALLAPWRVRSLTVVCSRDTPFPAFEAVAKALRSDGPVDPAASLNRWFTAPELAADLEVVEQTRRIVSQASVPDWAAAVEAIAHYDASAHTPALAATIPVTLIAAAHDAVSTPTVMQDMANRMPGSAFVVMRDWAHMSPFAHPDRLAELIMNAVARIPQ